jgi:Helix-turn-helix domain
MTEWLRGPKRAALREDLARRYCEGASIRALRAYTDGRSYTFVHQLLREAGVTFRPRTTGLTKRTGAPRSDT